MIFTRQFKLKIKFTLKSLLIAFLHIYSSGKKNRTQRILMSNLLNRSIIKMSVVDEDYSKITFDNQATITYWNSYSEWVSHSFINFHKNVIFKFGAHPIYFVNDSIVWTDFHSYMLPLWIKLKLLYRIYQYEMRTLQSE